MMRNNVYSIAAIFSLVAILTASGILPVLALDNPPQHIETNLDGFVVMFGCCPDISVQMQGSIITESVGTVKLSSQIGSMIINEKTYALKFEPTGKVSTTPDDICMTSTSRQQPGVVELVGNDGVVLKGTGVYSWGTAVGCSDGDASFTNFSGKFHNTQGQTIEFYTGTDSLPIIQ